MNNQSAFQPEKSGLKNWRVVLILSICMLLTLQAASQIRENDDNKIKPSDSVIYSVINSIISNQYSNFDYRPCNYILDHHPFPSLSVKDSIMISSLDTIFSKADLKYIFRQSQEAREFRINKSFLISKLEILSADSILRMQADTSRNSKLKFWEAFHKRFGESCFFYISCPIFSLNFRQVIIKYSISCGTEDGEASRVIMRKYVDGWRIIYYLHYSKSY